MLSILPSGNIPECWQAKGNLRCLGDVKRENIIWQESQKSTQMIFYLLHVVSLQLFFIVVTVVMVYLNFSCITVQIRHTPNYPRAKSLHSFIFCHYLNRLWCNQNCSIKMQSHPPHLGVFFEFDFWTFTLPSNLSTIPQLNFKNVSEIHQYRSLRMINLGGYITNGSFSFHLHYGEILVTPVPLQTWR